MLGTVKTENEWNWFASGKHPVAKDFIRIGRADSVFNAITGWMDSGYRGTNATHERLSDRHSWRFWFRGAKRHSLVCGVLKDSCDSIGRTYPFVLMGNGPVERWTLFWDLLPLALENTWNRIEHILVQRFIDIQQVEEGIRILPLPLADWRLLSRRRQNRLKPVNGELNKHTGSCDWQEMLKREAGRPRITIPLGETWIENQETHVLDLLQSMKVQKQAIPTAVFIGGVPDVPQIVAFNRALMHEDFIHLWAKTAPRVNSCDGASEGDDQNKEPPPALRRNKNERKTGWI